MIYSFFYLFLIFLIYSILGYLVEVVAVSLYSKKINFNRGFLIGPYLPIYGVGSIMMIYILDSYRNDFFALFIMSCFYCCLLEYLTSYLMEKIFHLRWWDYSEHKFNINGRICLENGVLFGLAGIILVYYIHPLLEKLLFKISPNILMIFSCGLFLIFIIDVVISFYIIFQLRNNVDKYTARDATAMIREEVRKKLQRHSYLTTRLIKSFPNINLRNNQTFLDFKKLILKSKEEVKKIKRELKERKKQNKLDNKGFTLVELLVSISIMAIIMVMAFPSLDQLYKNNRTKKYTAYQQSLESAAKLYVDANAIDMFGNEVNACYKISYAELQAKTGIRDFRENGVTCSGSGTYVIVRKKNNQYTYQSGLECTKNGKQYYKKSATNPC